jgi:ribonuclease Z
LSFSITILGSSGALPAYGRFPSCQLVQVQNRHLLIDCGEGAQMQLMKMGIGFHKISHIFISHLHGDHYLGLMGLLFSMHLNRREKELHIYSFPGLDEIILAQLRYSQSVLRFRLHFHCLTTTSECIWEDDAVTVTTLPLTHKLPCVGFLIREKQKPFRIDKEKITPTTRLQYLALFQQGKNVLNERGEVVARYQDYTLPPKASIAYAYCSDTAYTPALIEPLKRIDLLYHEATFLTDESDKAIETLHSTAAQAAQLASEAGVKRLLIGHFSARYKELAPVLAEATAIFPETLLATEGLTIELDA